MNKTKFRHFQRFDKSKASEGVQHRIVDEQGQLRGTFTASLFDPHSKFVQVEMERYSRKTKQDLSIAGADAVAKAFIIVGLHDWTDVLDADGKPVPFSKDTALEFFTEKDPDTDQAYEAWTLARLLELAQDVRHYAADPVAQQDEVVKN